MPTTRTIDAKPPAPDHALDCDTRTKLLPDDLFNVPQNIVVPKDRPATVAAVNALIDEVGVSGFLQSAIERGGAIEAAVVPAGVKARYPG